MMLDANLTQRECVSKKEYERILYTETGCVLVGRLIIDYYLKYQRNLISKISFITLPIFLSAINVSNGKIHAT